LNGSAAATQQKQQQQWQRSHKSREPSLSETAVATKWCGSCPSVTATALVMAKQLLDMLRMTSEVRVLTVYATEFSAWLLLVKSCQQA
jgi:hypothetical protein